MDQRELWDGFHTANGRAWNGNSCVPDQLSGSGDALDLDCGNGKTVSALVDMRYKVTRIDLSPVAISICGEKFGDATSFTVGNLSSLLFLDESFDYVTALHVLEHIDDAGMPQVSAEIQRVLRPEGCLFISSFTQTDIRSGTRSSEGIMYLNCNPGGIAKFFRGMETEYVRHVDEPTRFGTTRFRAECLFRKPSDRRRRLSAPARAGPSCL